MNLVYYHGDEPLKIIQEQQKTILKTIVDSQYKVILECIRSKSKSTHQISRETGISISNTYRKLHDLNKKKILIVSGGITSDGKREFLYKSKIREIITELHEGKTVVKIYSNLRD